MAHHVLWFGVGNVFGGNCFTASKHRYTVTNAKNFFKVMGNENEEVTGIALYLASEASSFTTGGHFVVDGGQVSGTSF